MIMPWRVWKFNFFWKHSNGGTEISGLVSFRCFLIVLVIVVLRIVCAWCRNDGMEDRYSVLIELNDQKAADGFYCTFNGKNFSPAEVFPIFAPVLFAVRSHCQSLFRFSYSSPSGHSG